MALQKTVKIVDTALVKRIGEEAARNPRLRKNHNMHPSDESRCHRLLNAIEPDSYIRPHRHMDPEKDEAFIIMSGRLGILLFDDEGRVVETLVISHSNGNLAADIPHGLFHTAVSLEPGTVFYEAKAGPYRPLQPEEIAPWGPEDGTAEATEYLEQLRRLFE